VALTRPKRQKLLKALPRVRYKTAFEGSNFLLPWRFFH
jgi:hypothetical protein